MKSLDGGFVRREGSLLKDGEPFVEKEFEEGRECCVGRWGKMRQKLFAKSVDYVRVNEGRKGLTEKQ